MQQEVDSKQVSSILENHCRDRGGLIATLEEIQAAYGYLPHQALRIVADSTGRSLVDIYGIATFYRSFSLEPRGKHLVSVCLGTACHVRGAARIAEEFECQLGIQRGETTADKEFTLETVNCLGACALGPVVVIDGHYFSKVRKSKVKQLLHEAREGFEKTDIDGDQCIFPIEVSCPRCSRSLMDKTIAIDGYPSIRVDISVGNKRVELRLSSLYGSHNIFAEYDVPAGAVATFSCPHCNAQLVDTWKCPICGAAMVPMSVRGGGMLRICARRGCGGHMLNPNVSTL